LDKYSKPVNEKEVKYMPRRDGTGPNGKGSKTGRKKGKCE